MPFDYIPIYVVMFHIRFLDDKVYISQNNIVPITHDVKRSTGSELFNSLCVLLFNNIHMYRIGLVIDRYHHGVLPHLFGSLNKTTLSVSTEHANRTYYILSHYTQPIIRAAVARRCRNVSLVARCMSTLRRRLNRHHFAEYISKIITYNGNAGILIKKSLFPKAQLAMLCLVF